MKFFFLTQHYWVNMFNFIKMKKLFLGICFLVFVSPWSSNVNAQLSSGGSNKWQQEWRYCTIYVFGVPIGTRLVVICEDAGGNCNDQFCCELFGGPQQ